MKVPIFDAHLDLAWNALSFNRDLTLPVETLRRQEAHMNDEPSRGSCTTSLPEFRRAGVAVCLATLLARSGPDQEPQSKYNRTDLDYASPSIAYSIVWGQLAYYRLLERQGHVRIIRTAADLDLHWQSWQKDKGEQTPLGIIISLEGCDPILSPEQLDLWWKAGLRVAGLVHYGRGRYGYGTGVEGPLDEPGDELLRAFSSRGIVLDVTHLSDRSFGDALDLFDGYILASHHNCRALVPGQRQLSDSQIKRLIRFDAVIGMAFDAWMLYPGWKRGETTPDVVSLEAVVDHIDHICQLAGNVNHVGIGSDLDGGFGSNQTPHDLDTITDLQKLPELMSARGYQDEAIEAVFHGNWLHFFRKTLP